MIEKINAPCVLVMEDNAIIGALYADVLVEMGHVLCAIETTEEDAAAAFPERPAGRPTAFAQRVAGEESVRAMGV